MTNLIFLSLIFNFNSVSSARVCKTKSAAADYKCTIKKSKNKIDIKYRYLKAKRRSVSLEYTQDKKGPYAIESFIVKKDPAKLKVKKQTNCMFFGLIGKCVKKKIKICDSVLTASHSETYGAFSKHKYARTLSFDIKNKNGFYAYFRRTPKASPEHRLEDFKLEFDKCKLIKEY